VTPSPPSSAPSTDAPLQHLAGDLSAESGRSHILVVDDIPLNRQFLKDELEDEGYLVSTAEDGEQALAIVADDPPDLILLDVMMPKLDGFEVCRRLKSDERTILIPVVMFPPSPATRDGSKGFEVAAIAS